MIRAVLLSLILIPVIAQAEAWWPQFRGPTGDGHSDATNLPVAWSETEHVSWKTAVPGKGWSSPVVQDGLVWLTTAVEEVYTEDEETKILNDIDAKKAKQRQLAKKISLKALCIDLKSGERVKTTDLLEVENPDYIHTLNSYASPTPVIDENRIYCHFGTFGTVCLDTKTHEVIWKERLPLEHSVGPGSSPFLYKSLLVLVCDGVDVQYVIALDKMTGKQVWKTDRPPMRAEKGDQKKAYCTPIVVNDFGRTQLVIPASQWLISYEPDTGKEIWRVDHGSGFSLVPRPVYGHGMVFFATGFGKPQLWAVRADGEGDVTETHVAWKSTRQIPQKPSPILIDDELYVISDSGITTCFDALTGEVRWIERVDGNYSASPVFADGKIYFCSHEGKVTIIEPGDQFKEVAVNEIDGQIMASPVPLDGALLLRSDRALYRIAN